MADYTWGTPKEATPKQGTQAEKELGSETRSVTEHFMTAVGGRPENVTCEKFDLIKVEGGPADTLYPAADFNLNIE
jgi:hypothetical protein